MRLLVVEDDPALGEGICNGLRQEGYTIDWLQDGVSALHALQQETFDLVVLDLGLPRLDGIEVLRRLRAGGDAVPVLILTARDATDDRIAGLDAGADDYLVKPFALQELHARIRALYKRSHRNADNLLAVGDLTLNRSTLQVHRAGRRVDINPAGMKLLRRLMEKSPAVVERDELETLLWADERPDVDLLRSHMHKLRQAIDRQFDNPLIHTVHRIGYRIAEDSQ